MPHCSICDMWMPRHQHQPCDECMGVISESVSEMRENDMLENAPSSILVGDSINNTELDDVMDMDWLDGSSVPTAKDVIMQDDGDNEDDERPWY